ncbi:alpha/beta fold hydrolase [Crossiella cryophila]|uniref:Pimeloyl-ACP methyl ester carboxylesterase n=1 Tax=Crossiella cryophila TaxID=43355 RepID=A0A7W7FQK5_9PSEU|nr:alpha/beta fold hydrolase [Crossiella cryophila]MBB4674227.1 pimeloyl-ACP methyl ester carboxylesterase [Crossiella cryophila]
MGNDATTGLLGFASGLLQQARHGVGEAFEVSSETLRFVRSLLTPGGLRGATMETAWLAAHAVLYPWGALTEQLRSEGPYGSYRTDGLPPMQRGLVCSDLEAAGTPIVLVHGIGDNRSIFTFLAAALRRRGFGVVHAVNYSVLTALTGDIRAAAEYLGRHLERICEQTGAESVHVVGHSLGGVIARYHVQKQGGDARVRSLVTLGSPHAGTMTAYLLPTRLARQLRPGSKLLGELAEPAPGCRTRFLAVWSELDQIMIPQRTACLEHPDLDVVNHRVRDVGHLSLPVDPAIVHTVLTHLTRSDGLSRHPVANRSELGHMITDTECHLSKSQTCQ